MYAKVFNQIYDSSVCEQWEVLVTFQQLLVLADKDGVIDMTLNAIHRRTNIPKYILEKGIEELMLPDKSSRTPDMDGRRIVLLDDHREWGWQIINYHKYTNIKSNQDRKEYMKNYMRGYRKQNSLQKTNEVKSKQKLAQLRHIDVDVDVNVDVKKKKKGASFKKPSVDEIKSYCLERENSVDAESFFNFYESKGWFVGKSKMKDWKACVRTWEKRESNGTTSKHQNGFGKFESKNQRRQEQNFAHLKNFLEND